MAQQPTDQYQLFLQQYQDALNESKGRYNFLSYARLGVFVLFVALAVFVFRIDFFLGMLVSVVGLGIFLYLVKQHVEVAAKRAHLQRLIGIAELEQKALAGDRSDFSDGKSFINSQHAYSFDLDIFGRASIFQAINRTATVKGKEKLAAWLQAPFQDQSSILRQQEAIQDWSQQLGANLDFEATGAGLEEKGTEWDALTEWLADPVFFKTHPLYPKLLWILPGLFVVALLAWIIPDIPALRESLVDVRISGLVPTAVFFLNLIVIGPHLKRTGRQQAQLGKKSNILRTYARLLKRIEDAEVKSERLASLQKRLIHHGEKASAAIERLGDLTYYLDQRLNPFAGVLLNGMMLWDIRCQYRLEVWKESHREALVDWLEVMQEWDALNSLARYAANHPAFVYPKVEKGPFHLHADALGHPLLNPTTRVDNDVMLNKPGEFLVITGANMAGKSTFLRTVGVNLILAMCGVPVCAKEFRFSPIEMITSVRATDSLDDNESYFYAELKQLKAIIDKLKQGKPVFIIVDEMLRGTNSKDKQTGSIKFIEQLIQLKGVGLIATHDLALGNLADQYPEYAFNKRFEVDIYDDHLDFDYKLKDGISQNLNATFLMQKMGIMP
ncbi:MAG: hypothetical protein AAF206_19625 [Bacteroidota bacterium]